MRERPDLALRSWGDALRRSRHHRRQLRRYAIVLGIGATALLATIAAPPAPRLVWNASASAPLGLYRVDPSARIAVGDMVIAWPPPGPRALAAQRHYLPANVPVVKRVAAGPGQRICAVGRTILVGARAVAERHDSDALGRILPRWTGCARLRPNQFLLLMTANRDSFDGRYFGPSRSQDIVGKATPVWLW